MVTPDSFTREAQTEALLRITRAMYLVLCLAASNAYVMGSVAGLAASHLLHLSQGHTAVLCAGGFAGLPLLLPRRTWTHGVVLVACPRDAADRGAVRDYDGDYGRGYGEDLDRGAGRGYGEDFDRGADYVRGRRAHRVY